jgi:hypothetical protein
MLIKRASLLALLALPSAAYAQQDEPPAAIVAAPIETVGPNADANIDRGFLLPTAMTQPKGTLTYNNYELLLHGLSYGVTDRVQVTATVLSPIVKDMPFIGWAAVKAQVANVDRFHLAVQGTLGYASVNASFDDGRESATFLGTGALASLCLRDDCASLFSASATYQAVLPHDSDGTAHLLLYGGSLVVRVSDHVKLLAELDSGAGGETDHFENAEGLVASYGVRFYGANIASDVGFIRPIATRGDDEFLMGLPFASLSYRWR